MAASRIPHSDGQDFSTGKKYRRDARHGSGNGEGIPAWHIGRQPASPQTWSKWKSRLPALRYPILLAFLLGGIVWGLMAVYCRYPQIAASYLKRQLATASGASAEEILQRAIAMGDAGLPVLVEALDAKQPQAADAAKRRLGGLLARWQTEPAGRRTAHILALSEALAEAVEHFGPDARMAAADLAQQILESELTGVGTETMRILAAGEKVIRASHADPGAGPSDPDGLTLQQRGGSKMLPQRYFPPTADRTNSASRTLLAEVPPLPGGDLSMEPQESSAGGCGLPPFVAYGENRAQGGSSGGTSPLSPVTSPPQLEKIPVEDTTAAEESAATRPVSEGGKPVRASEYHEPASGGPPRAERASARAALTDSQLAYWLRAMHSADPRIAAEAESVLAKCGLSAAERELGRQIYDPHTEVRQNAAEKLPGLQGVDVAGWMMLLCRDEDAEVRWTAFAYLATATDPRLLMRLEALARSDSDPRIQRLAEQIAPKTDGPRRR
jgi:hypothetical protein